jgi:hypothetical protein
MQPGRDKDKFKIPDENIWGEIDFLQKINRFKRGQKGPGYVFPQEKIKDRQNYKWHIMGEFQ